MKDSYKRENLSNSFFKKFNKVTLNKSVLTSASKVLNRTYEAIDRDVPGYKLIIITIYFS